MELYREANKTTNNVKVLITDKQKYIKINDKAPWGTKCILIRRDAGVAYIGILKRTDKFPTHYYPLPTFED